MTMTTPIPGTRTTSGAVSAHFSPRVHRYYDSLGGSGSAVLETLARWVSDESHDKRAKQLDTSSWRRHKSMRNASRQQNGHDCGVFTLAFASAIMAGRACIFKDATMAMQRARLRIAADILSTQE